MDERTRARCIGAVAGLAKRDRIQQLASRMIAAKE
jgi:hypothetical protein